MTLSQTRVAFCMQLLAALPSILRAPRLTDRRLINVIRTNKNLEFHTLNWRVWVEEMKESHPSHVAAFAAQPSIEGIV